MAIGTRTCPVSPPPHHYHKQIVRYVRKTNMTQLGVSSNDEILFCPYLQARQYSWSSPEVNLEATH